MVNTLTMININIGLVCLVMKVDRIKQIIDYL